MKQSNIPIVLVFILWANCLLGQATYTNPILAGFYPDPSICRVNNDYYLVNSSFAYFPGLPIFHSTDLVNWQQIGNAMNRDSQFDLSKAHVSGGLYAPAIRYSNGTFYIMCTNVSGGGNFIITTQDPKGAWSDPVFTPAVRGIDPSLFFDDNGKVYITYNSDAPNDKPLYDGHRTIRLIEYNVAEKKTVGENKIIVNGGTDLSKKPVWIEGPHLYKRNGWYYLMCAEGGTADEHSEVIFRSKNVEGPFIPYAHNPILTQRNLDSARSNPITSTGHADLVETPDGKWYAVFLGCRPYKGDYYNTGRETFMMPVAWKDGWPIINPSGKAVQYQYPAPFAATNKDTSLFSGNYQFREEFNNQPLHYRFVLLRNPTPDLYGIQNGNLSIPLKPVTVAEKANPALVGFRQAHQTCSAETNLRFEAKDENEKAGLVAFQNERYFYYLCQSIQDQKPVVELYKSATSEGGKNELLASATISHTAPLQLKIEANKDTYSFSYKDGAKDWQVLQKNVDGTFLSTHTAGGFVGCLFGLYATSNGSPTHNTALYDWFFYKGDDEVFKP